MTTDNGSKTSEAPKTSNPVTVCPNCGRKVSPTAVICGICLRPIHSAEMDQGQIAAREAAIRAEERRQRLTRASFMAVVAVTLVGLVYLQWFRPASALPTPTTVSRSIVPATEDASQWPSVAGNAQLHRATAARPDLGAPEHWRMTTDERITTPAVVGERLVYVGVSGSLIAASREDGREVWRMPVAGQLDAAPTLVGDRLYVPLREGSILAVDANTGKEIWKGGDGPTYFSSVTVFNGVVYGGSLGRLTGLDAETGRVLWSKGIDNRVSAQASPAVTAGHLVALTYRRALLFDRYTGEELFYYSLPAPDHLMVEGNRGFIVAADRIIAFGFDQRRPWWEYARTAWGQLWIFGMAPAPPPQPRHWVQPTERGAFAPAVAGNALIVATSGGLVRALDLATGEQRWEAKVGAVASAPTVTVGGILLVQREGLLLLDATTGAEVAKRPMPGGNLRSAAVTSGGTYVVAGEDSIIALR